MNNSAADTVLVSVDGKLIPISSETMESACYHIPGDSLSGRKVEAVMLYESRGLHHHTNASVEKFWQIGPVYVRSKGVDVPLHYAYVEKERGLRYSSGDNSMPSAQSRINKEEPLLKWYQYSFELPDKKQVTPMLLD